MYTLILSPKNKCIGLVPDEAEARSSEFVGNRERDQKVGRRGKTPGYCGVPILMDPREPASPPREPGAPGDSDPGRKGNPANSEARKEQNRIAARNYRQRKKQRLAGPDQQPDPAPTYSGSPQSSADLSISWLGGQPAGVSEQSSESSPVPYGRRLPHSHQASTSLVATPFPDLNLNQPWIDHGLQQDLGLGGSLIGSGAPSSPNILLPDYSFLNASPVSTLHSPAHSRQSVMGTASRDPQVATDLGLLRLLHAPGGTAAVNMPGSSSSSRPPAPAWEAEEAIPDATASTTSKVSDPIPLERVIDYIRNLSAPQQQRIMSALSSSLASTPEGRGQGYYAAASAWRMKEASPRPSQTRDRLSAAMDLVRVARLPDVKRSRLYVAQLDFLAAAIENAGVIGLSQNAEVFNDEGCSPYTQNQIPTPKDDPERLARAQQQFCKLQKDLRPVDAQLTAVHHPWVDIIPFKTFRERCMAAISSTPPMIDEWEMCDDLFKEALICWGSRGSEERGGMSAAVPWDARSWEPSLWFLKKYWFLVGGWDDEMWTAARWWHAMRDEELDVRDVYELRGQPVNLG
ncbi:hypothetical protein GQ53DRAFT_804822 [Thozetella sp. PMI_491]|nr:hypothetical protein GQ53DRAFT_804822 [Thozetella sp. PMI_491]